MALVMQDLQQYDQDNFVEKRDPAELAMCIVLSAIYLGLARYCWTALIAANNTRLLFNIVGFFVTIALLSLVIGLRPYISPCSLQLSGKGIKYRGPYWPQRKTVNWEQVFRVYLSPELIVVLYHPLDNNKSIWPLLIQSIYLADKDNVPKAILKYSPISPILLSGPNWLSRLLVIVGFILIAVFVLQKILGVV